MKLDEDRMIAVIYASESRLRKRGISDIRVGAGGSRHGGCKPETPDSGKTVAQTMTTLFFSCLKRKNKYLSHRRNLKYGGSLVSCLAKKMGGEKTGWDIHRGVGPLFYHRSIFLISQVNSIKFIERIINSVPIGSWPLFASSPLFMIFYYAIPIVVISHVKSK